MVCPKTEFEFLALRAYSLSKLAILDSYSGRLRAGLLPLQAVVQYFIFLSRILMLTTDKVISCGPVGKQLGRGHVVKYKQVV